MDNKNNYILPFKISFLLMTLSAKVNTTLHREKKMAVINMLL